MTTRTQSLLLVLVGTLGLRLALSDVYLCYVHSWMKLPIVAASAVLLVLGIKMLVAALRSPERHEKAPPVLWLMFLPVLVVFLVSPPALGAYAAQRSRVTTVDNSGYSVLTKSVTSMKLGEFLGRSQWGDTLKDHRVSLTGFVSEGKDGAWYVTRMAISCCAADAVAYQIQVAGVPASHRPATDQWISVVGTWKEPGTTHLPRAGTPVLVAESLQGVQAPTDTYE